MLSRRCVKGFSSTRFANPRPSRRSGSDGSGGCCRERSGGACATTWPRPRVAAVVPAVHPARGGRVGLGVRRGPPARRPRRARADRPQRDRRDHGGCRRSERRSPSRARHRSRCCRRPPRRQPRVSGRPPFRRTRRRTLLPQREGPQAHGLDREAARGAGRRDDRGCPFHSRRSYRCDAQCRNAGLPLAALRALRCPRRGLLGVLRLATRVLRRSGIRGLERPAAGAGHRLRTSGARRGGALVAEAKERATMTLSTAIALGLALVSTTLTNVAYLRQHDAAAQLHVLCMRRPLQSARILLTDRSWMLGFAMETAGFLLYATALALASLALVQSVAAGGIGVLAFVSARVAGPRLRP